MTGAKQQVFVTIGISGGHLNGLALRSTVEAARELAAKWAEEDEIPYDPIREFWQNEDAGVRILAMDVDGEVY